MTIKIDDDIKLPPRKRGLGRPAKYPFAQLQIGQSFFCAGEVNSFSGLQAYHAKRTGFTFTARSATEAGVKGTRIWRVK